jgi:hypothetical protein
MIPVHQSIGERRGFRVVKQYQRLLNCGIGLFDLGRYHSICCYSCAFILFTSGASAGVEKGKLWRLSCWTIVVVDLWAMSLGDCGLSDRARYTGDVCMTNEETI